MNSTTETTVSTLDYLLQAGYIHNWLVAGPLAAPVHDLARFTGADFKRQIAQHYHRQASDITATPAERLQFAVANALLGEHELTWRAVICADDHFVDLTDFYHTCHYLCGWAYAQVDAPSARSLTAVLTTNGPADVWLNGRHVHRQEHFSHQIPARVSFQADLAQGANTILVRFEEVAVRECPYAMALQITDTRTDDLSIHIPTTVQPLSRRRKFEELLTSAYLTQGVYHREDQLEVHWPEDLSISNEITVRLQARNRRIYAEGTVTAGAGAVAKLGSAYLAPDGAYDIVLMPKPEEFYIHGMRVEHRLPLQIVNNPYAETPEGVFTSRRIEALRDAARRKQNIFSEIAKMALGEWQAVDAKAILDMVERINQRADCSDFYLVGLLGMLIRYREDPSFPQALVQPLEECVLNFKYWLDEPGSDAMCFWSENHQILFHTCEVLAGQLYPDRIFSNVGESGRWHQAKGERLALAWLQKRARGGFREWDSNTYFEEDVLALAHLTDLADDVEVAEMAAVVLDKLLLTLALNSFKGVFGSTHGRSYTPFICGARQEPTSGISRLLWGLGAFNDRILGTVSLACAEGYALPPIIAAIATDTPYEMWNRERHAGVMEEACDLDTGAWEINKVTYRTPDFMLCSAQDYQPGMSGYQQHIWQATLGPDAVVFVTHPPCVSEDGSHRPNFWHGNVVLPRVAQWKDALIAVHNLPEDDWTGFTHAYFPVAAFDEVAFVDGWAFARKGEGYLALTAAQGIQQITRGYSAYRELRSYGHRNVWFCQLGRATQDGDFVGFQRSVLALPLTFGDLAVTAATLRGDTLAFGWTGPLYRNGAEEAIGGFNHYENPYCVAELPASEMVIQYGDQAMRLHF